ncbi:MAG TPA: alpha-glucan family phosphorylase [Thermoclostridium sp.]|nr:alpha-glucan family phosphorylase [Clostridiaceae bacterium]HOQ75226.1 alpha-glucan family phosphorylase [Thermoclostridium sp.]HPU44745.1 alpha-glucan family phosphorylase [Thermoclostridium sp.]
MDKLKSVAYFCMEYGIESDVRLYAGGLGILAGDYMKEAFDQGYPIVGIGILWKQGYGEQFIDQETGMPYDAYKIRVYPFLEDTGVTVSVAIRKRDVKIKVWRYRAHGVDNLYLLDTDIEGNDGEARWITGQLYGWFGEERVAQEMVLGIGGVRALRALGFNPQVYHFNEGHALFAGFELIREKMARGMRFREAWKETRKEVVFTTHTPVPEGNEQHPIDRLIYMGANLNMTRRQLKAIGGDPFNMTAGALRLSRVSNAVSDLHRVTAMKMWKKVKGRSEIIGITNGIHIPTWVDRKMLELAEEYNGAKAAEEELWSRHMHNKDALIDFIEKRTGARLDRDVLLIGFARRAAPYKRSGLLLSDLEFLEPLLRERKLQIVFSGKSHPLDDTGKGIVAEIVSMTRKYPDSIVFLENYDMEIGRMMTRGADVWLNNPRRPQEASGTSGMKAAMNGVLNVSILDGWWPEACKDGENGWQFGDGYQSDNAAKVDKHDLKALKTCLVNEVIPTYYENRSKWVEMMVSSIRSTREPFGMKRVLEEYYKRMYNTGSEK